MRCVLVLFGARETDQRMLPGVGSVKTVGTSGFNLTRRLVR